MALGVRNPHANVGDIRDTGSIPGLGRSPRRGNGNPLQYSCLENPRDGGAWRAHSPWSQKESNMTDLSIAWGYLEGTKQLLTKNLFNKFEQKFYLISDDT